MKSQISLNSQIHKFFLHIHKWKEYYFFFLILIL